MPGACLFGGISFSQLSKETIAVFMFISQVTEAQGGSMTRLHLHMGSQDSKYSEVHDISEAWASGERPCKPSHALIKAVNHP